MTVRRRAVVCLLVHVGLLALAIGGLVVETELTGNLLNGPTRYVSVTTLIGYPVCWMDREEHYKITPDGREPVEWPRRSYGGWNPAVPVCLVVIALCLPTMLTGGLVRVIWRRNDPVPGRKVRAAGVLFAAALAGLVVAAVEADTHWGAMWRANEHSPFFAHPPGLFLTEIKDFQRTRDQAARLRWRAFGQPPEGLDGVRFRWWFGTQMTVVGMLVGGLWGVIYFRPLRSSASDGAAATTPPSA
jgi:hypothetical protein